MSYMDNCKDKEMIAEDLLGQRKCAGVGRWGGRGRRIESTGEKCQLYPWGIVQRNKVVNELRKPEKQCC